MDSILPGTWSCKIENLVQKPNKINPEGLNSYRIWTAMNGNISNNYYYCNLFRCLVWDIWTRMVRKRKFKKLPEEEQQRILEERSKPAIEKGFENLPRHEEFMKEQIKSPSDFM